MSPNEFATGVDGALKLLAVGSALPGFVAAHLKKPATVLVLASGLSLAALLLFRHANASPRRRTL